MADVFYASPGAKAMAGLDPVTLSGRWVRLEPLAARHVDELWPSAQDADTWRFMTFDVNTKQDLVRWVAERVAAAEAGTAWAFLQRDQATSQAFGCTNLFDVDLKNRKMEVGHTWIDAGHRGKAHNPEAKLLLLQFAFERQHAVRVQIKTDARNARSRRAIEKLGAHFEGILRNQLILPDGFVRDAAFYSVIDREWPSVRRTLEGRLAALADLTT